MDIILLTTAAITLLKPFLTKSGEKIAEAIGEDFYKKVKGLFKKKADNQLLEKAETGPVAPEEVTAIEETLKQELPANPLLQARLTEQLNLTPANTAMVQNTLRNIQKLRTEIGQLNEEYVDAGVGTVGDYKNKIAQQERKLNEQESKLYHLIYKPA